MDNLDKIVAQMPRVEPPCRCWCEYPDWNLTDSQKQQDKAYHIGLNTLEAQCQHLAEQGWRKVPSKEEWALELCNLENWEATKEAAIANAPKRLARNLRKWLMGDDG